MIIAYLTNEYGRASDTFIRGEVEQLRKLGYDGWFSADVFNYREDGVEVLKRVVQVHRTCTRLADKLITMNIEQVLRSKDGHLEILRILWDMLGD